ncbi:MAG: RHS repeat protein, partial [Proteobacteria bacterium]|nr:RHS repeat protein [Pseudomonadota bacterium]
DITNKSAEHLHFVLDAAGNRTEEDYYNSSNVIKHKVLRDFDLLGRLKDTKNAYVTPASLAMSYLYDGNGNVKTATDGRNHVTSNNYDPRNRLVQAEEDSAAGGLNVFTTYVYDTLDRLRDVQDPQGLHTAYTFDGLDNLKQLGSPDTGVTTYGYDSAGNRTSQTDARNTPSAYTYDALNRPTGATFPNTPSLNVTYTWDTPASGCVSPNRLSKGYLSTVVDSSGSTTFCYDRFGDTTLKTQTISGASFPVSYAWNRDGRLNSVTEPNGTLVSYLRDNSNRIITVQYKLAGQSSLSTLVSSVAYNPFGSPSKINYGNGRALSRTYDMDYVIKSVVDASTVGDGLNLTFGRDAVANLTSVKLSSTVGNVLVYDGLNRLKQVNDLSSNPQWRYTYDGTGNRLSEQQGTQAVVRYTYPTTSHHLIAVGSTQRGFDNAGNTTSIGTGSGALGFHFDDTDRMDQFLVGGVLAKQYLSNAFGQRVMKSKAGDTTQTIKSVFDEQGHRLGDFNSSNATIEEYLWMDDLPIGVVDGPSNSVKYIEPDHQGTPRVVVDPGSNVAIWNWSILNDPFGQGQPVNLNGSTFSLGLRLPGQMYDAESGMAYNYFRDFDAARGRYLESDPIGLGAGTSTYAYSYSSPVVFRDAAGLNGAIALPVPAGGLATGTGATSAGAGAAGAGAAEAGGGIAAAGAGTVAIAVTGAAVAGYATGTAAYPYIEPYLSAGLDRVCRAKTDDCAREWEEAYRECKKQLSKPNPARGITGGYRNLQDCARGLVSERCGGNPVSR